MLNVADSTWSCALKTHIITEIAGRWPGILDSEGADSARAGSPWSRDSRPPPQNTSPTKRRERRAAVPQTVCRPLACRGIRKAYRGRVFPEKSGKFIIFDRDGTAGGEN